MQTPAITINISVGLTERLYALLEGLGAKGPQTPPARAIGPDRQEVPAEVPSPVEQPVKPAQKPSEKKSVPLSEVRAAMDRARLRIEGQDYSDQESEGRKRYHKELTALFIRLAKEIAGAARPSELPDDDSRFRFVAACDAVRLDSDGNITEDLPSYE